MSTQERLRPACTFRLTRVFVARLKTLWIHSYLQSALRKFRSDCADAQADLSLRWAHMHSCRKCCAPAHMIFLGSMLNVYFLSTALHKPFLLSKILIFILISSPKHLVWVLNRSVSNEYIYPQHITMARSSLGPWKFIPDIGSSSH